MKPSSSSNATSVGGVVAPVEVLPQYKNFRTSVLMLRQHFDSGYHSSNYDINKDDQYIAALGR